MPVPTWVRSIAVTAVAGLLAACAEAPTSATAQREGLRPPFDAAASMGPNFLLAGDVESTITVDPNATRFYQVGAHWVYIPKGAVCRLDSSYGVGEWDKDCVSETVPFTIPVITGERNGHVLVEFGRDLRFKPTTDPWKGAYLFLREPTLEPHSYGVLWQGADGAWIDEAAADPSLRAFRVGNTWIARRVKHFSGYNVSLGLFREQLDPTALLGM